MSTDQSGLIATVRNANNAARVDIEAIKARAAAATEGPWVRVTGGVKISNSTFMPVVDDGLSHNNGEFIAAARADVPALIAEVERLRAIVEARP